MINSILDQSKKKIVLPDGSQVWLNSGSKISYPKQCDAGAREVTLSGEAYFDVTKKDNPLYAGSVRLTWVERGLRTRFIQGVSCGPIRRPGSTVQWLQRGSELARDSLDEHHRTR